MEKEKSEIESEAVDGNDGEDDLKQGDIKPDSESLTLDETVRCENVIYTTEDRKEEDASENTSSAAAVEEAMDEDISSKDDGKEPVIETRGTLDFELEQKNNKVPSTKKMTVGSNKPRSEIAEVTNG
jgi:hypothetical protein